MELYFQYKVRYGQHEKLQLKFLVVLGQSGVLGLVDLLLDLGLPRGVHGDLWGHQGGHGHELQVGVSDELPSEPEERLLKVVV